MSDGGQDGLITDTDFGSLVLFIENSTMPTFLADEFARQDNLASENVEFSTGWSYTHLPADHSSQVGMDERYRPTSTPQMLLESVDVLHKLGDIKLRLVNLIRSLSSGNIPENIEDIYRTIETLTNLGFWRRLSFLLSQDNSSITCLAEPALPHVVLLPILVRFYPAFPSYASRPATFYAWRGRSFALLGAIGSGANRGWRPRFSNFRGFLSTLFQKKVQRLPNRLQTFVFTPVYDIPNVPAKF
jgi:hypothetical protein